MHRQIPGLFKCHLTLPPVLIDVITNMVEDPCDEVHVFLQIKRAVESSGTTCTWDFQIRVVRLLMILQLTGLFTFETTLFSVVFDVITNIVKNPCDEVRVRLQITGMFKRPPTRFPIFANMVTPVMVDLFVYVVRVLFQFTRISEGSVTSQIRAFPWLCAFRLLRRCFVHYNWNRVSTLVQ